MKGDELGRQGGNGIMTKKNVVCCVAISELAFADPPWPQVFISKKMFS